MFATILVGVLAISSPPPSELLPSDCLYAIMLLQSPSGTPEQIPPEERWNDVRKAIQHYAIKWQIMDKREAHYVMAERKDFLDDLNLLRTRYDQLKDVPLLECITPMFPDRSMVNEALSFNRAYRENLATRLVWESDRADIISAAIAETDFCYKVWDALRDVQADFYYITVRRFAYQRYKKLIEAAKWDREEIYPYVPYWRFQQR